MNRADDNRNQNDNSYDPFEGQVNQDWDGSPRSRSRRLQSKTATQVDQSNTGADFGCQATSSVVPILGRFACRRSGDNQLPQKYYAGRKAGVVSPEADAWVPGPSSAQAPGRCQLRARRADWLHCFQHGQTSQPFYIGSQSTFTHSVDGRLYLMVNDDNYAITAAASALVSFIPTTMEA